MTKARDLANIISGGFDATDIPNLDTSKITTGTFADARMPSTALNSNVDLTTLSASNLTSGTLADARFPSTLPAVSGANLTNLPAGGGLVQTVSASTVNDSVTSSFSFVDSNLTLNITPSLSSNKIFLVAHFGCEPSVGSGILFDIKRTISGSSTLLSGTGDGMMKVSTPGGNPASGQNAVSLNWKDTPNTTSQITYTIVFKTNNGEVEFNNSDAKMHIMAMEVSV